MRKREREREKEKEREGGGGGVYGVSCHDTERFVRKLP